MSYKDSFITAETKAELLLNDKATEEEKAEINSKIVISNDALFIGGMLERIASKLGSLKHG
jgi:hypothetical protein